MANNSIWSNLSLILLSGVASFLSNKVTNSNASWVPVRNEIIANTANVVVSTVVQQLQQNAAQQQAATTEPQKTTAQ